MLYYSNAAVITFTYFSACFFDSANFIVKNYFFSFFHNSKFSTIFQTQFVMKVLLLSEVMKTVE